MGYTVYKHTCPNNKVYIGITGLSVKKRWANGYGYRNNRLFFRAIEKYGWNNIKHEVLYTNLTKEEAEKREVELISLFKCNDKTYGYNISAGGSATTLGIKMSTETKGKISKSTLGRIPWNKGVPRTKQEKQKMSQNRKGIPAWNKGHAWSQDVKANISTAKKEQQKGNPLVCCETGDVYYSASEAQRQTGIDSSSIRKCCKGIAKSAGGFRWRYLYKGVA